MLLKIVLGCIVLFCVVAGAFFVMNSKGTEATSSYADVKQLQLLLSEDPEQLTKKIAVEPLELSIPADGKGPRLLARVPRGMAPEVPESITVTVKSEQLVVPITVKDDYEVYEAQ